VENSKTILETILEITNTASEDGMDGGSIVALVNMFGGLLTKHDYEDGSTEDREEFTNNIVTTTSVLIEQEQGWSEIESKGLHSQTFSSILLSMDNMGYIFGKHENTSECNQDEHNFQSENVNLKVRAISASESNTCHTFGSSGSICLPPSDMKDEVKNCSIHVASSFSFDSEKSNFFPDSFKTANSTFGNSLIGLRIDNGSIEIQLPEDAAPIVVTFKHFQSKV
jgi:hypothetical protein